MGIFKRLKRILAVQNVFQNDIIIVPCMDVCQFEAVRV